MGSVSLLFNTVTLQHYCPAWQECVECSSDVLRVGNHVAWALGSSATVETYSTYLSDATILSIQLNITLDAGMFDIDFESYVRIFLYVDGTEVYSYRKNITGLSYSKIMFDVGAKVNGRVSVKYEVGVRAACGYIIWSFSNPTIIYEYNPPSTVARLTVETHPSGATVYVDGSRAGTSPVTLDVSEGYHEISAELAGYMLKNCVNSTKTDSMCRVYCKAGEVTHVVLELEQIPAPTPVEAVTTLLNVMPHLLIMVTIAPLMTAVMNMVSQIGKGKD